MTGPTRKGPLAGIRVVEMAGLGPSPFCGMLLADMGAEVMRIDRPDGKGGQASLFDPAKDILSRGRISLPLDLKSADGIAAALAVIARADILIEGFRPGVMERLGLGPEACLKANPKLIYGRMTGWGQEGPLAHTAGHDLNYISLSGALHAMGMKDGAPAIPLNLVGDFGGGAMLLAFGILSALIESRSSGQGQVVDAAMTDGTALLLAMTWTLKAMGQWRQERGSNLLDGGAHFYGNYRCADGKWLALGAIEPQFYARFLQLAGLDEDTELKDQSPAAWSTLRVKLENIFLTRSRDEWCARFAGSDACLTPILDMDEAVNHPQNRDRGTYMEAEGIIQPTPAPRFSRTPTALPGLQAETVSRELLERWGVEAGSISAITAM